MKQLLPLLLLTIGCKGALHSAQFDCDSSDADRVDGYPLKLERSYSATWCAASLEYFLREHPDITVEDFSIVNRSHDFAKVVITYRGDLALTGDRAK